jgi:hypothetical protein
LQLLMRVQDHPELTNRAGIGGGSRRRTKGRAQRLSHG